MKSTSWDVCRGSYFLHVSVSRVFIHFLFFQVSWSSSFICCFFCALHTLRSSLLLAVFATISVSGSTVLQAGKWDLFLASMLIREEGNQEFELGEGKAQMNEHR